MYNDPVWLVLGSKFEFYLYLQFINANIYRYYALLLHKIKLFLNQCNKATLTNVIISLMSFVFDLQSEPQRMTHTAGTENKNDL